MSTQLPIPEGAAGETPLTDQDVVDELEEEITCAVCQEHFEEPKILPCCHYYCRRCVQALVDTAATHGKKSFSCPECRTDTAIPQNNPAKLPTAFFVNRMKALYTKREKTYGKVRVQCEQCSPLEGADFKEDAVAFCRQCTEFICERCIEAHKRMKAFSSHRVSTLEELRAGSVKELPPDKPPAPPTCSAHDEQMRLYCYDCQCLICQDCIVIDHNGHKYEFVKKMSPEVKEKLAQEIVPLKKVHMSLGHAIKVVEATKLDVEASGVTLNASIRKSFQALQEVIDVRKQEVLKQTAKFVDTKFDRLSTQEKELQQRVSAIQKLVEFVEQTVQNMTDDELVSIHTQVLKQIVEETKKHQVAGESLRPVEEADITFEMNCLQELRLLCREKVKVHSSARRKVVWVDPRVGNRENSSYVRYLRMVEGISLHATTSATEALEVLLTKDPKVEYRAITAGTGGKEFIECLRANEINCPVLVFCASIDWHSKWARKFKNVEVTVDPSRMYEFATWERL